MTLLKLTLLLLFNTLLLPVYIALFIFCFFLSFIPIFPTKTSHENLKTRLHVSGLKAHFYIARIFLNYFFYIVEALILDPLRLTHSSLQNGINVAETLKQIKEGYPQSHNVGFVYILPHMANVEMYTIAVIEAHRKLQEKQIYALAKPTKIKLINKFLIWYRQRPGMGIFWTDNNLLSNMWQAIKQGASMAMVVDQKPKTGGCFIRFFNEFAVFPTSGLRFCMNKNMIVIYCSGRRFIPGWLKMNIQCGKNLHLQTQLKTNIHSIDTRNLMQAEIWKQDSIFPKDIHAAQEMAYFVDWIEAEIKKSPTQWCWDYRKWSRKPV